MIIDIKVLNKYFYDEFKLPGYATQGSAGVDLRSTVDFKLFGGESIKVGTGIAIDIQNPEVVGLVLPRSGLGSRGLVLANSCGVIDSDYQGEITLVLLNRNSDLKSFIEIKRGERVAQLLFMPVLSVAFRRVESFKESTDRLLGGFGSTGEG